MNSSLSLTRYRVTFKTREKLDLPGYLGSTLRGAFGHAFRSVACPAPRGFDCPVPSECPYHLVFESSPSADSDVLRTHEEIPRPFVIAPSQSSADVGATRTRFLFHPGEEFCFELVLIGRAQKYFPHFVVALREVDRMGRGRRCVELNRIEALDRENAEPRLVYDVAENLVRGSGRSLQFDECSADSPFGGLVDIEFLTQTRLKHEGNFVRFRSFRFYFDACSAAFPR